MSVRSSARVALPLVLLATAACGDSTGPTGPLTDFLLDFCADETPVYVAVQNDGSSWSRVPHAGNGTFALQVAPEVGLALVRQDGADYTTEFVFATAEELEPLNGVACNEGAGTKILNGTVSNVDDALGEEAWISMARQFDIVQGGATAFTLQTLPDGPLDLVAHRDVLTLDGFRPERVIVRRALNLVHNASITPVLDFEGGDSQAAVQNTLTISGLAAGEDNTILSEFRTAAGTVHSFYAIEGFTGATQTIYGMPAALTQSGDLHDLDVYAYASTGDAYRGVRQFHRLAGDRVAALGAQLNMPLITSEGSSPYVRLRMRLQSQGDYNAFVSAYYIQGDALEERVVVVTATASYIGGTPDTWDLTIPLMTGADDFPIQAMLEEGFATTWYVDAFGGGVPATFFGFPEDGAFYRYASRSAAVALGVRAALRATDQPRRPATRSLVRRPLGGR